MYKLFLFSPKFVFLDLYMHVIWGKLSDATNTMYVLFKVIYRQRTILTVLVGDNKSSYSPCKHLFDEYVLL
jgi:hypothetical protein